MAENVKEAAQQKLNGLQGDHPFNNSDCTPDLVFCRPDLALAILDDRTRRFERMIEAFGGAVAEMHATVGAAS